LLTENFKWAKATNFEGRLTAIYVNELAVSRLVSRFPACGLADKHALRETLRFHLAVDEGTAHSGHLADLGEAPKLVVSLRH